MSTLYLFFANSIAMIHLMVALYLISLPVVIFLKKVPAWYLQIQISLLGIAAIFHFTSGVCPLTFGEKYFRVLGGGNRYDGNFLNHYSEMIFDLPVPDKLLTNSIIILALLLIFIVVKRFWMKQNAEVVEAN